MEIKYDYSNAPTIREFAKSKAFIRGLMGPVGGGKSSGCVIEIIRRASEQEPGPDGIRRTRWAVIRNTYPQLQDTTIKTFMDWVPETQFGRYNKAEHTYKITGIPGLEIEILFRALDNPKHVQNLLSLELTGAWVNEAREVPWSILEVLMTRVDRYPSRKDTNGPTWTGLIFDTNPPDDESWWFELFETDRFVKSSQEYTKQTGRKYAEVFKQPSGRSPQAENTRFLSPNYYTVLAANPDPDFVKVYVDGEYGYVKTGKPVYPTYRDNQHCQKFEVNPHLPIYRGWDYGLTPACIFVQLTPNGQFRVFDELCAERAGIESFSDVVLKHCAQHYSGYEFRDFGDPAGNASSQTDEKSCFQIQRGKGIEIQPGKQSPEIRIESVRYGLNHWIDGEPGLVVHPKCKTIRKGFQGGYQYRRILTSTEKYTDKPDKNKFSHPHDALQYVAAELLGDLVVGMEKYNHRSLQRQADDEFDVYTGDQRYHDTYDDFDAFGG